MSKRQYKKSEISKKNILDAALLLVREVGFEKTTIRDITKKSGLSIGAFYHQFKSKDSLLNEAFILFDETISFDETKNNQNLNPIEELKIVLMAQGKFIVDVGINLLREYYRAILQEKGKAIIDKNRRYYKTVTSCVKKAQEENFFINTLSADFISDFLIKTIRGIMIDWCLHEGEFDILKELEKDIELLITPFKKI